MIDRRANLWLLDMRDHARKAIEFLGDCDAAGLLADPLRLYALNRAVEIVGEAANRVDPSLRANFPSIPWRPAIDMRNKLIHGYDRVDVDVVVRTVRDDFPALIAEIEQILNAELKG
jgi:uncharacterized protein with HEPN domain